MLLSSFFPLEARPGCCKPGTDFSAFGRWHVTYLLRSGVYEGGGTPLAFADGVGYTNKCHVGLGLWLADGQRELLQTAEPELPARPPRLLFVDVLELLRRRSLKSQEPDAVAPY